VNFTEEMFADVETELFSGPSPYGFFRPCRAYMDRYFMVGSAHVRCVGYAVC
jgi:hypothetical protein